LYKARSARLYLSSRIDIQIFEHDIAIKRQHIHQCPRHIANVDESRPWFFIFFGVLDINQSGTKVENPDICARLTQVISQRFGISK
jgi:hypothetical protein